MNLAHWLEQRALQDPERPALFLGQVPFASYGAFHRQVMATAGWLAARGVGAGDRVAIFMKNRPEYLVALYAIWQAGAAAVPINAKLHPREASFILEDADVSLAFLSPELAKDLGLPQDRTLVAPGPDYDLALSHLPLDAPCECGPDDMAWLFYTSGTTGKPKGVIITHGMLLSMALCYWADVDQVSAEDCALYAAPLSHGAGLYNLMHVRAGAAHVFPPSGGFDVAEVLALSAHFGRTHMFAAPTMVKRLTEGARASGDRGRGLRTVVYAGGPMYLADIIEAVDWFGPVFVQIYGQGECPMGITALSRAEVADRKHPRWRSRLGSVGRAQSAVEVRIGDQAGNSLPEGQAGEIMVRGSTVMPGYWKNPEASSRTLEGGWLHTGDVGSLDAEGYLTLTDRSKDVIITGGSNVYPREVEEVLLAHPGLREASVVGAPHAEWGEEVVAFVVGEASEDELEALCLEQIARFKRPKRYFWVPELPKNNYGKVLKTDLRKRLDPS